MTLVQLQSDSTASIRRQDSSAAVLGRDWISSSKARPIQVQLIHPPQRTSATNWVSGVTIPPLGLAYLAASLEATGHRVEVLDAIGEGLDNVFSVNGRMMRGIDFETIVAHLNPEADLIGLGMMFSCAWAPLRELVRMIKERFPDKPLVLGGEHPTALTELVFEQSPIDYVVRGEGEATLVELCNHLALGRSVNKIPGLAVREGTSCRINAPRVRVHDIDAIPVPAWRHFRIAEYIAYNQPHGSAEGRSMPMLATRGCPFQCTFCGAPGMWGTTWRPRDPKKVVDEIESYISRFGADDFQFEDLTAVTRKDWVMEFSQEVLRRGLRITWQLPSGTRSEAIDAEAAQAMHDSGCRQFSYALESGSEVILKRIKKRIRLPRAFASADGAMKAGIRVQAAFIYGFPGETWRQMGQTYRTILRCAWAGFNEINVSALQPLPNTEIFSELSRDGKIELDDAYLDSIFGYLGIWQQRSWNDRVSSFALRVVIFASLFSFFAVSYVRRPSRLLRLIKNLGDTQTEGKLPRILKGMIKRAKDIHSPQRSRPIHVPQVEVDLST